MDGEIQIAFDRYLSPPSITRQSVLVLDASGQPITPVLTRYDPVSRTISVARPNETWLVPGQPYKLRFTLPPNDGTADRGLRAIDGATLDPAQPLEYAFFAAPAAGVTNEKKLDFCGDVLPIFTLKCTSGVCHASGGGAAGGLVLDSRVGILETAIDRVANSANTGARSGDYGPPRDVFGIDMALIRPGEPDNSWLLYKIELAREPRVDAGLPTRLICNKSPSETVLALPTVDPFRFLVNVQQADDIERAILNDYVPGREMPYPPLTLKAPSQQALTFDERERIRIWIAQGANMTECGGCTEATFTPDAGTDAAPDAAPDADTDASSDAGADAQDQ